jgi:hypothetical protein
LTAAAEAAAAALRRGGTVFYAASLSANGHKAVEAAHAPAVTRDAGVMAAAAVARDVGACAAVAVRAAMRHGACLVPCLALGDDDVNRRLFRGTALGWAAGVSGDKATSAAHAALGGAAPSLVGAAALALASLAPGGAADSPATGTCAVYGRPIPVPHTSSPHPKVRPSC